MNRDLNINNFSFVKFFKENFVWVMVFACLVFFTYINSVNNDFISDDIGGIVNQNISSFEYVREDFSLNRIDFYLRNKISGLNPAVFRFVNIFTHFLSSVLIFIIFSILINKKTAIFATTIFVIHPILSESIVWISGAGYIMYSFFFFLSFLFFILSKKNKLFYIFSTFSFLISINFSEKAFILFLIFPLYTFLFENFKKDYKRFMPFIILGSIFAFNSFLYLDKRVENLKYNYSEATILNPFVQIPIAITSYLELIFWPEKLTLYHSEMSFSSLDFATRGIIFLGLIIGWIYSYGKNKKVFFCLSIFFVALMPFLTPFGISWIVAERYVYLGSVGIFAIVAVFLDKISGYKKYRQLIYTVFIVIIISLSIRTMIRNIDWKNEDNFWIATAKNSPSSPNAHNNLGDVYGRNGDLKGALREFKKAIEIKPNYADAYHNLANTYKDMGNFEEAIKNYNNALSINPYLWQSYQAIAAINFYKQDYDNAIKNLNNAIKINPSNQDLKLNLAIVYLKIGENDLARKIINNTLSIEPNNVKARELMMQINRSTN